MGTLRTVAVAAILASFALPSTAARACDSNYPWLCKPVPSIDPPEAATESNKPAPKPLQITSRRAAAAARAKAHRAAKASAKTTKATAKLERSKQVARTSVARREALRGRAAKVAAARVAGQDSAETAPIESTKIAPTRRSEAVHPPATAAGVVDASVADASNDSNAGFAAMWAERGTAAAGPVDARSEAAAQAASEPVAAGPVQVASQNAVNQLETAAPEPATASDGDWLRALFLAFGGLLALGSALRLFL